MDIKHVNTFAEAMAFYRIGYIPIECSFGTDGSVVDPQFTMDHHGKWSHLEGVALRAYRDHFGALRDSYKEGNARFVVTGAADADACFAIAALIGELPHPSNKGRDLSDFAALVNRMDTDPIGVNLVDAPDGPVLMLWNQMSSHVQDATAFYAGVDRWRFVMRIRPTSPLMTAVVDEEKGRIARARAAKYERASDAVIFVESDVWGFDVWYRDFDADVVVAFNPTNDCVTIGCPDVATAEKRFGPGGLKNVFGKLSPAGWGGRESIGGSPRGMKMDRSQAWEAAQMAAVLVKHE